MAARVSCHVQHYSSEVTYRRGQIFFFLFVRLTQPQVVSLTEPNVGKVKTITMCRDIAQNPTRREYLVRASLDTGSSATLIKQAVVNVIACFKV